MTASLRLHGYLPASRANGPGTRAVLWFQGCTLACPGCFNPETHAGETGELITVADALARLPASGIEGLTLTGGEPFQQPAAAAELAAAAQARGLSTLAFSGYRRDEIEADPTKAVVLPHLDVLVDGRYQAGQPSSLPLRGSANQTIHLLTARYQLTDFANIPDGEVVIGPDGSLAFTGVRPLKWPRKGPPQR